VEVNAHNQAVRRILATRDGRTLTGGLAGAVFRWNAETLMEVAE
jgi:hypothetical protein